MTNDENDVAVRAFMVLVRLETTHHNLVVVEHYRDGGVDCLDCGRRFYAEFERTSSAWTSPCRGGA